VVGGQQPVNNVTLIDVQQSKMCQLNPYPYPVRNAAGGVIESQGELRPFICGGSIRLDTGSIGTSRKCYSLNPTGWEQVNTIPNRGVSMASVPVGNKWLLLSGDGSERFLLDSKGQKFDVRPGPDTFEQSACGTVVSDQGTHRIVAFLGGFLNYQDMDQYNCTGGDTPNCSRLPDGPKLINSKSAFGCGALDTIEGGRVLIAMNRFGSSPTETLDLTRSDSTWIQLPSDMDVPESSSKYSFVTSTEDPTTGYYLPAGSDFMYRVKCQSAQSCNFQKIAYGQIFGTPGYQNPPGFVAMAVPANMYSCN